MKLHNSIEPTEHFKAVLCGVRPRMRLVLSQSNVMLGKAFVLFAATFLLLAFLGAQALYVNAGRYIGAFLAATAASTCNLLLYKLAPDAGSVEMVCFVMGGPCGLIAAMYGLRHLHVTRPARGAAAKPDA